MNKKNKAARPTFTRRLIQLYAFLLFNANVKGFITGDIFTGASKNLCTPGLHCYSCPGAVTACPLGALQNALASSGKRAPYYMLGIIMLYGIILGRWICGFLCPFGLIQDLLYKIKTPKLKKNRITKALSCIKYVLLALFVVILPLIYALRDMPLPAFCKYICPSGTLGGAISLLLNPSNNEMFDMLGPLFTWKFILLACFIVTCVFIFRAFCRFICPLGALYGIFNRFSILGIKVVSDKCTDCGLCVSECKMDITKVGDRECINCGECINVCPTKAIQWRGAKIILPENEIPENAAPEEKARIEKKREKRVLVLRIVAAVLSLSLLAGVIVYSNFIDKTPDGNDFTQGSGDFNVTDLRGKIVIVNFWGTWCSGCKKELPDFNRIADEYDGEVVVVAVHTSGTEGWEEPEEYIAKNFPDSKMLFVRDVRAEGETVDAYYTALGGRGTYPITLVLDKNGIITNKTLKEMGYDDLVAAIEVARSSTASPDGLYEGNRLGYICPSMDLEFIEP